MAHLKQKEFWSITVPVRLLSEANNTDHWTKKHKRRKNIKFNITSVWNMGLIRNVKLPVLITLTRLAPLTLDDDNLVAAFKGARDVVADLLKPGLAPGRADGTSEIAFEYRQQKSKEYGIRIDAKEL